MYCIYNIYCYLIKQMLIYYSKIHFFLKKIK